MNPLCSAGAAVAALVGSLALLGCAPRTAAPPPAPPLDRQVCAEEALRGHSPPSIAEEAAECFPVDCAGQDQVACSILGVMSELGVGVKPSRPRARSLYRYACEAGNLRACGNLGELLLADLAPGSKPDGALALLQMGCNARPGRACIVLGRVYASGTIHVDPAKAAAIFQRACISGDASGCLSLADVVERGAVDVERARVAELLRTACVNGSDEACARLERLGRSAPPVVLARGR